MKIQILEQLTNINKGTGKTTNAIIEVLITHNRMHYKYKSYTKLRINVMRIRAMAISTWNNQSSF